MWRQFSSPTTSISLSPISVGDVLFYFKRGAYSNNECGLTLDCGGEVDVRHGDAADAAQVSAASLLLLFLDEPPGLKEMEDMLIEARPRVRPNDSGVGVDLTYLRIAPHVGPTMRRRNVEQSDSLQRRTIRQVEGDAITLGENSNKSHL